MSAVSGLARGLGIEAGEGRPFAWGATTLFLIGWASVSLTNVSETFFLKRVGVGHLPAVFLVNGLLLAGTTYFMSRIAARSGRRRLLARTFAALGAMVIVLWLLVLAQWRGVFVVLVIAAKQLDAIAIIVFWTVLGGILHGRQAKRLYAPMIAGGTLGRILGSFASGIIGNALGIAALLPVSALAIGLAGLLAARTRFAVPARMMRMTGRRTTVSPPTVFEKFGPLWRDNRLFRLLVLSALLSGTIGPMLYFQFSYIVDLATRGANGELRLLDLYARLRGVINLGVLGMQLFGTGRVFRRIGVPLASTLSPLVYLVGFVGISTRADLRWGIGAVGAVNLQDHAVQEPAQRILATLFPERLRAAATSLIEGPAQRLGGALGNVLVLCVIAVNTPAWIGMAALPIAGLWLALAIALWRIYPTLLLEVASADPRRASLARSVPELMDPGTLRVLHAALVAPDPRRCRAACALVVEAPRARAVTALATAAPQAPVATRPLLVEALHRLVERDRSTSRAVPGAAHLLEPLLADVASLPAVERAHLVEVYACLVPSLRPDTAAAHVLTRLLSDPVPAVRLAATVYLRLRQGSSRDVDTILSDALTSDDSAVRHVALEGLRATLLAPDDTARRHAQLALVAARLDDPRDRARSAEVLADIALHDGPLVATIAGQLLAHTDDQDPRVRAAVLRFIGYARVRTHVGWVTGRLASPDEAETAAAAETLRLLGTAALSALLDALHRGRPAVRAAALPILHDVHCDAVTLRTLIDDEIRGVHRLVLQRHGLRTGHVSDVVLQRFDERIAEGVQTTLLLLATVLHEDRIAMLANLLMRSAHGRGRAVLLEALEALLPPAERVRLMQLLEGGEHSSMARDAAHALRRALPTFDEALREACADHDLLTHTLLAATLDAGTLARVGDTSAGGSGSIPPDAARVGDMASNRDLEDHGARCGGTHEDRMLNKAEIILHLRSLELFARLTTRELGGLADLVREETYAAGTTLMREGEFGDWMYLVIDGEVRVTCEGRFVTRVTPGGFFGEMALFDGETRSATCTAATRMRLLRLERHDLLQLMDDQPGIAIAMCQALSGYVRVLLDRIEGRGAADEKDS